MIVASYTPCSIFPPTSKPHHTTNSSAVQADSGHGPIQFSMSWSHGLTEEVGQTVTSTISRAYSLRTEDGGTWSSETLVSYYSSTRCLNPNDHVLQTDGLPQPPHFAFILCSKVRGIHSDQIKVLCFLSGRFLPNKFSDFTTTRDAGCCENTWLLEMGWRLERAVISVGCDREMKTTVMENFWGVLSR